MPTDAGESFVAAIAAKDSAALAEALHDTVDFRGLTPGRSWEARTPAEVLDIVLGHWFAPEDRIDSVSGVEHGEPVGDVRRVGYRFDLTNGDGPHTVEQQAYYREAGGRLTYLRIVCSGFQPRTT